MAEKMVSPGVFTEERDLSFLPIGIGEIGAAFVGPTVKGPAFVPTIVESRNEFENMFGPTNPKMYTPYAVRNYLKNAGRATMIRTLGLSGYSILNPIQLSLTGSYGTRAIGMLLPTYVVTSTDATQLFEASSVPTAFGGGNESGSVVVTVSGSYTTDTSTFTNATDKNGTAYSASLDPSAASYIGKLFGYNVEGLEPVYNYLLFDKVASASLATDPASSVVITLGNNSTADWDFTNDYQDAVTPWITSQKINGSSKQNLFRFYTRSHGSSTNYEVKVVIENIRRAGTISGTDYGAFDVVVRRVDQDDVKKVIKDTPYTGDDSDARPGVLEVFSNVNLDVDDPNYIGRRIGDRWITVDTEGKLTMNGDYTNNSKYIRVDINSVVKNGAQAPSLLPFGFRALVTPGPTGFTAFPSASFVADQNIANSYNSRKPWGFDFFAQDNMNYLKPLPVSSKQTTGSNAEFYLGDYNQPAGANYPTVATAYSGAIDLTSNTGDVTRKFAVPFQGGFDGHRPHLQRRVGSDITTGNSQGFDMTAGNWGDTAYRRALDTIKNQDEFDINMLVTPGILYELHSGVCSKAKDVCEDRSDAFYVMDGFQLTTTVTTAKTALTTFDSNYAGVWYPWVKTIDVDRNNKPMWIPPSVVIPGVIAFNDKSAQPWFAPAGLNRGGIPEAVEAYTRLTHSERDELYENRINPIASFPREGVVVWGQKNLQKKPSALDRINVRRLLITIKKFIASSSRYLVFEQNTAVTRNQFLNIVNPYLESVQQRQGLYGFKVVMDETNNTPDIIDRNILVGEIFIKPARTAEFISLTFNVLPTAATFDS
jgi:hypothetical protein